MGDAWEGLGGGGSPRVEVCRALSRLDHNIDPLVMFDDALVVAIEGGHVCLCILPSSPTLFIVWVTPQAEVVGNLGSNNCLDQ